MSVEDELKSLILSRYKSLREFCIVVDLPYSTVTSILKRGIENAGISKVIKICKHFNISADELANGRIVSVNYASYDGCLTERESIMVKKYRCLTPEGKETVDTILDLQCRLFIGSNSNCCFCTYLQLLIDGSTMLFILHFDSFLELTTFS